jgi:hypothetical protein
MLARLLILLLILPTGCVHRIQVQPFPAGPASTTIPKSIQIVVGAPALEGADHRPGITFLEWPHHDLRQAVIQYAQHRGTFSSVLTDHAEVMLRIGTKLALVSRQGRYHYHIRVQAETSEADRLIKTYLAEGSAPGSVARWVTDSDRDPIESALQLALDDLFAKIEADHSLYADEAETLVP